jgi:hypothetical protein
MWEYFLTHYIESPLDFVVLSIYGTTKAYQLKFYTTSAASRCNLKKDVFVEFM